MEKIYDKYQKLFKTARERTISGALGIALLFSSINLTTKAENLAPSPTAFGEPSAFGSNTGYGLDTDDTVQKVYFGKNGDASQGWYIVGYDETKQNLVLFCDPNQPMLSNQIFLAQNKYDDEWCNTTLYEDGETYTTPTKVYANHYGGSDIKKDLQKLEKDTKVFTAAEQDLMKESRVQTYDHLKGTLYTTTNKLYLATGDLNEENTLIKVGDSLSGEFNVELASGPDGSPYTTEGQSFWLRTPHYENHLDTLEAETGEKVTYKSFLDHGSNCVPAFALDTSSMLFASSAVPVSSNSTLSDGIYFRFKDTNSKIDTTLAANSDELTITKGNKNVYLYIQGKDSTGDWVCSKLISNTETLAAKDIHEGLTSFSNCKAWLEASEDNITYAQELNLSDVSTIKLLNVYSVSIKLKDEFGKVITNTKGITLKLDETPMEDNGNGVFTLDNLTNENYKLTIIVDENVSDYLTPGISTFTITNGSNGSIDVATLNIVVKLQQKEIEVKRVLTGAGGEADHKYNRKTGKTKFYCSPSPGYKLDKILKDADDKTEYVSFKIV
ncbi:MAG: hypothetical protein II796_02210 [Oscillospiraceae bacterium]|nr:hypothetical protein [Oscillospiraceae bacterium]